ncbi:hypothetical protein ABFX02_02G114700 [Erythranthe guttata]
MVSCDRLQVMDWNDTPKELLDLMLSNVVGKDRHSFSQVCRSWKAVIAASPYHQSPCLMMFNRRDNHLWKCFQHNNFFYMAFPKLLKNASVCFSNHGWLLMKSSDDHTLFFYDPCNNQMIELPSIPSDCKYTTICFFHPPTSPECLIIGIRTVSWKSSRDELELGVLKHGENKWRNGLFRDRNHQFRVSLGPPILHGGKIYFLDFKGNVALFDVSSYIWLFTIFPRCLKKRRFRRNIKEHFLIKPNNEETIFAVFVVGDERKVRVFRLVDGYQWERVEDLGDMVFYVSNTSSFGYTVDDKSMANKIFFSKLYGDKIVFYSMDTRKYHTFECNYSSNNSHEFTRLDFATWIMPELHPQKRELTWCR